MGFGRNSRVNKKFKALRVAALLGAVGGASVFLGLGSTAATAGEQRLHNEFSATYGLIPLYEGSGNIGVGGSLQATKASVSTTSRAKAGNNNKPDEPKLEDPELPGYDGNNPDGPQAMGASASRGG